jgi:hypothetical protein
MVKYALVFSNSYLQLVHSTIEGSLEIQFSYIHKSLLLIPFNLLVKSLFAFLSSVFVFSKLFAVVIKSSVVAAIQLQ